MAIVRAVKSGNWSDTTVWNTGALPTSADDVYSNTFTVTIDTSPTVLSISNASATGVTAGGSFLPTNGTTIRCTGAGVLAGATGSHVISATSANWTNPSWSASIIANCIAGSAGGGGTSAGAGAAVYHAGAGTLNIIGSITGGSNSWCPGVGLAGPGTINLTGTCVGGSLAGSVGAVTIFSGGTGTVNITGDCNSSATGSGQAIINYGAGTFNITGSLSAGATSAASNSSSGLLVHTGAAYASTSSPAIAYGSVSQVTILSGPLISSDGSGGTAAASGVNPCTAARWFPANTALGTFEYRMRGATAAGSPLVRPARQLFLTDAYAAGYPAANDVRSGTTYGAGGSLTGTCAVPGASSVVVGVPVDNTTGTAAVTANTIRSALGLASANLDTQLSPIVNLDTTVSSRLAASSYQAPLDAAGTRTAIGLATANLDTQLGNIPANVWAALTTALTTAGTIGKRIVDFLDVAISSRLASSSYTAPLDAAGTRSAVGLSSANLDTQLSSINSNVSSRLASASYTVPPTAAQNASAVRTELSTELGRIDTTVSSRLPTSGYTAPLDASGTRIAIGLSSANLDTQLGNLSSGQTTINNNVSTRLAASSYTVPPTAAQNASAVRTELSTELSRIDTTVSSRLSTSGYTAPLDSAGTRSAIGLSIANLDSQLSGINSAVGNVPTATQNASAVRTELSTELNRIDTTVSSRLATSGYTAPLDASGTRASLGLASANLDTQLSPLPNLDTTVSSRLAGASYTAPLDASSTRTAIGLASANLDSQLSSLGNDIGNVPTAVENASAVRAELSTELGRIDTAISTRSTFDPALDTVAKVTLVDTTTDLTNPPVVPTPEQIALAVANEIDPTLTEINDNVLTRLAAEDYVEPPTSEQNAQAVRAELQPELGRVANAATTEQVADIVEGSLGQP